MGQQQNRSMHGTDAVKATIKSIEDNSQTSDAPLKQTIVQNVTNTKVSGEGCLGGSHKSWSGGKEKY